MKKIVLILSVLSILFCACEKEDEEEFFNLVRVENQHANEIHVIIAEVDFGTVNSGTTTSYLQVPGGVNDLGGQLTGTITLPDETKFTKDRRFTVTIDQDGQVSIAEDL